MPQMQPLQILPGVPETKKKVSWGGLVGKDWGSQGVRVDDVLEFEEVVGVGEEEVVAVAAGDVLVNAVHFDGEGFEILKRRLSLRLQAGS